VRKKIVPQSIYDDIKDKIIARQWPSPASSGYLRLSAGRNGTELPERRLMLAAVLLAAEPRLVVPAVLALGEADLRAAGGANQFAVGRCWRWVVL